MAAKAPTSTAAKLFGYFTALRTFIIDFVVVGLALSIIYLIFLEMRRDNIVIEEIGLPKHLTEMGYSGQVASLRLWDALHRINDETARRTDFEERTPWLTESEQIEVTETQSGISLKGLTQVAQRIGQMNPRRIAGEFVCDNFDCASNKFELRLRVFQDGRVHRVNGGTIHIGEQGRTLDQYFYDVAAQVVEIVHPILAAEFYNTINNEKSKLIAESIVQKDDEYAVRAATILGQISLAERNLSLAEGWLLKSLEMSDGTEAYMDGTTLVLLGDVYATQGRQDLSRERYREAIDSFTRAAEVDETSGAHSLSLAWGTAFHRLEMFPEAVERFQMAVDGDPSDHMAYAWLGQALYSSDPTDADRRAEDVFGRAIENHEEDNEIYLSWGHALLSIKRFGDAIEKFKLAKMNAPSDPASYLAIGDALLADSMEREEKEDPISETSKMDDAAAEYRLALELDEDLGMAYFQLGTIAELKQRLDEAASMYAKSAKALPGFTPAYEAWAWTTRQSLEASADEVCDKFAAMFPELKKAVHDHRVEISLDDLQAIGGGCG